MNIFSYSFSIINSLSIFFWLSFIIFSNHGVGGFPAGDCNRASEPTSGLVTSWVDLTTPHQYLRTCHPDANIGGYLPPAFNYLPPTSEQALVHSFQYPHILLPDNWPIIQVVPPIFASVASPQVRARGCQFRPCGHESTSWLGGTSSIPC